MIAFPNPREGWQDTPFLAEGIAPDTSAWASHGRCDSRRTHATPYSAYASNQSGFIRQLASHTSSSLGRNVALSSLLEEPKVAKQQL